MQSGHKRMNVWATLHIPPHLEIAIMLKIGKYYRIFFHCLHQPFIIQWTKQNPSMKCFCICNYNVEGCYCFSSLCILIERKNTSNLLLVLGFYTLFLLSPSQGRKNLLPSLMCVYFCWCELMERLLPVTYYVDFFFPYNAVRLFACCGANLVSCIMKVSVP